MIYVALAVVVFAILVRVVMSQPTDFVVRRSAILDAPPEAIFPLVNDFHGWQRWSPWEKMDPDMTQTYEGPSSGVGAVYKWSGNSKVGQGQMTILESQPFSRIEILLEFLKPFQAKNGTLFELVPRDGKTEVVWSMSGRNETLVSKVFSLLMNMDKMVGKEFEKGLADLNAAAQSSTLV